MFGRGNSSRNTFAVAKKPLNLLVKLRVGQSRIIRRLSLGVYRLRQFEQGGEGVASGSASHGGSLKVGVPNTAEAVRTAKPGEHPRTEPRESL